MCTQDKKVCYLCKIEKPLSAFIQRIDDQYYNMCTDCVSDILRRAAASKGSKLHHTDTHRTCYLCRRLLPVECFTRRSNGKYFSACKDCNKHVLGPRRRMRLHNAPGSHTTAEWIEVVAQYDRCPMCQRKWEDIPPPPNRASVITVDHIVPVTKGGSDSIENLRPLCYSCNSKKGDKLV